MATITKHVGKIKDAGTRVAIMYRTLPDDKESALVVSTDNLPTNAYQRVGLEVTPTLNESLFLDLE